MEKNWLERTELLIEKEGIEKLQNSNILVVGLGGVGSYAAEFLARAGIGKMTIIDGDAVDETNINRQLPALQSTIGKSKAEIMHSRLLDINPRLQLMVIPQFLLPEDMQKILEKEKFDYIVDCIDSVSPKISLIKAAKNLKLKIVSCMGAGGKLDPSKVMVRDLSRTHNCFLAKQVRKRLKKENIHKGVRCVFSKELQKEESLKMTDGSSFKKSFYGTISFIPALFGLYAAAEVVNFLLKNNK